METATITPDIRHLIQTTFEEQRAHAPQLAQSKSRERRKKLDRLQAYLREPRHIEALNKAMHKDLGKPETEVLSSETGIIHAHIRHVKRHLRDWMADKRVSTPWSMVGTRSWIRYEPKGVCLILSPWNYPLNLAIVPLIYALAAGNAVILKPSEISSHTSAFIRRMIAELFDDKEVAVFEGDASVAKALLDLPFNHIFFTGSPAVGKKIMKSAARHLSSVTLELGGKSPAIIDPSAKVRSAAWQCAWAKHFNTGQTCIAPDYVLAHASVRDSFIRHYREAVQAFYDPEGKGIHRSPDYGRIVNHHHFDRLHALYSDAVDKGAQVALGGDFDAEDLYISPTLLTQMDDSMDIMQEEIFGPLMPVLTYTTREEAVDRIRLLPKPLTLYINSRNQKNTEYFLAHTSAGGTVVNEYLLGYNNPDLPFGGVNHSGIGKSFGHHGFVEFSNERGVIRRNWGTLSMIYPPYNERIRKLLRLIARWS